ncbi:MAG: hypothetical protein JW836_01515 [Deltaproteobacteria bacterium]|nr:hypothetical protein [Deltaproteobacteria bacterium]
MPEIKSTLDLIMEKAEKFTVTDEEKAAFRRRELEGKIKGLVQKYLDGLLDLERLKEQAAAFAANEEQTAYELMRVETLQRIKPGQNNERLLNVLSVMGVNVEVVKKLLRDFEKRIRQGEKKRAELALENLRKRGISGSAVIPNLDGDQGWLKILRELNEDFHGQLKPFIQP